MTSQLQNGWIFPIFSIVMWQLTRDDQRVTLSCAAWWHGVSARLRLSPTISDWSEVWEFWIRATELGPLPPEEISTWLDSTWSESDIQCWGPARPDPEIRNRGMLGLGGLVKTCQDSDCLRSESIRNLWSVKMYEASGLTYCIHLYSLWAWSAPPLWSFDPLCTSTFFVPWHMSCRIISIFRRVSLRFSGSMPRIDQNGWVSPVRFVAFLPFFRRFFSTVHRWSLNKAVSPRRILGGEFWVSQGESTKIQLMTSQLQNDQNGWIFP